MAKATITERFVPSAIRHAGTLSASDSAVVRLAASLCSLLHRQTTPHAQQSIGEHTLVETK
jgi:hypothetical protein